MRGSRWCSGGLKARISRDTGAFEALRQPSSRISRDGVGSRPRAGGLKARIARDAGPSRRSASPVDAYLGTVRAPGGLREVSRHAYLGTGWVPGSVQAASKHAYLGTQALSRRSASPVHAYLGTVWSARPRAGGLKARIARDAGPFEVLRQLNPRISRDGAGSRWRAGGLKARISGDAGPFEALLRPSSRLSRDGAGSRWRAGGLKARISRDAGTFEAPRRLSSRISRDGGASSSVLVVSRQAYLGTKCPASCSTRAKSRISRDGSGVQGAEGGGDARISRDEVPCPVLNPPIITHISGRFTGSGRSRWGRCTHISGRSALPVAQPAQNHAYLGTVQGLRAQQAGDTLI